MCENKLTRKMRINVYIVLCFFIALVIVDISGYVNDIIVNGRSIFSNYSDYADCNRHNFNSQSIAVEKTNVKVLDRLCVETSASPNLILISEWVEPWECMIEEDRFRFEAAMAVLVILMIHILYAIVLYRNKVLKYVMMIDGKKRYYQILGSSC